MPRPLAGCEEMDRDVVPGPFGERGEEAIAAHRFAARPEPAGHGERVGDRVLPELEAEGASVAGVAQELDHHVVCAWLAIRHRLDVEGEAEEVLVAVVDLDRAFGAAVTAEDQLRAGLFSR